MFKHAYVRGIQTALVNSGAAAFPDQVTATKVADYIAARVEIDPLQGVSLDATHKIASDIVQASDWIKRQPGFKAASWNKLATWDDVTKLADYHATDLMTKAAEGSTIEGGDKGNTEAQSPVAETKMDAALRPPGYAENSLGKTDVDTRPGAVGKEEPQPKQPSETDHKDNSVQEHSRTASLGDLFRKSAEGSTIIGGDKGNKDMSSSEAKMDAALRPPGYAVLPHQGALGAMMEQIKGPAVIGRETAQPMQPGQTVSGSNSLTEHSAKAASEDPYITLFKKVASEIHEYLPGGLRENDKIAAVRACMGMTTEEKAYYLRGLQKEASDTSGSESRSGSGRSRSGAYDGRTANQVSKQANDLPPFMKKDDDDKKDDDKKDDDKKDDDKGGMPSFIQDKIDARNGEKKDGDKDEKSDDKKEASLRDMFRRIDAAQRA